MMGKLLFLSTPIGPLGSGMGGGVELTLYNLAREMSRRGYQVQVVAPAKSTLPNTPIIQISGQLQIPAQSHAVHRRGLQGEADAVPATCGRENVGAELVPPTAPCLEKAVAARATEGTRSAPNSTGQEREVPICLPPNSVLANMWDYARRVQDRYDLILNFAYDWLPFYLTPFFLGCPVAHLVSMSSVSEAMDCTIRQTVQRFPHLVAFHSQTQAATFGLHQARWLGNAIDLPLYQFCESPASYLAWVGRISPEKALEDAIAAAQIAGIPLKIFGKLQDTDYWQKIQADYPDAPFEYMGFLTTEELQEDLGKARALLMTPRWVEAFGNVMIEALACGVPVIAYRRGGPVEVVRDGKTGFLVEPDSVMGLVEAIGKIETIDRLACRQQAEGEYSLEALGDRTERWFQDMMKVID